MAEEKWKKIDKLYDLGTKGAPSAPPKHVLFSWKCPKCSSKLSKESLKEIVFLGDSGERDGAEVLKKILAESKVEPGVYNLSINHFSCNCGYEFAKVDIDPMGED